MKIYRVTVHPGETGYKLEVTGLRTFDVSETYEGTLEEVARAHIAAESNVPIDDVEVRITYAVMKKFQRNTRVSWQRIVAGLVILTVAAIGLALANILLIAIAGAGGFMLGATQFFIDRDGDQLRVQ